MMIKNIFNFLFVIVILALLLFPRRVIPRLNFKRARDLFGYSSLVFLFIILQNLFSLGYANGFKETPFNNKDLLRHIKILYSELGFSEEVLSFQAFQWSLTAYYITLGENLVKRPNLLTIIDYAKPCNKERFFTIDLRNKRIVLKELVSHGRKSGSRYARSFSNKPRSLKSSIGLYITLEAYRGKYGYSLRLRGLERGYNDNAERRNIVIHEARHVNKKMASNSGCIGTSWGCLVVSLGSAKKVIDTIKNGSVLFIYYPLKGYLQKSEYTNLGKAATIFNQFEFE